MSEESKPKIFSCDEALRAELRTLIADQNIRFAEIASDTGYSVAVVSLYLNEGGNRYDGNTAKVEKRFREFIRDRRLVLDSNVPTIACDVATQICDAIEDIRTGKRIGLVVGAPGIGKSRGIQHYCDDHELAIASSVWSGACNKSSLEDLLFAAADVARTKSGQSPIQILADKLRGTKRVLLIDDAHKLTCPALQLVYDLRDQTGMPVALFGDDRLIPKIRADGQRLRRTGIVYPLKIRNARPLVEHHIRQIVPEVNGELPQLSKLCIGIAEKTGHFGSVQMELALAVRLKKGCPEWSWCEAVRNAHKRLIRDYDLT